LLGWRESDTQYRTEALYPMVVGCLPQVLTWGYRRPNASIFLLQNWSVHMSSPASVLCRVTSVRTDYRIGGCASMMCPGLPDLCSAARGRWTATHASGSPCRIRICVHTQLSRSRRYCRLVGRLVLVVT